MKHLRDLDPDQALHIQPAERRWVRKFSNQGKAEVLCAYWLLSDCRSPSPISPIEIPFSCFKSRQTRFPIARFAIFRILQSRSAMHRLSSLCQFSGNCLSNSLLDNWFWDCHAFPSKIRKHDLDINKTWHQQENSILNGLQTLLALYHLGRKRLR